nr:BUL1 [Naumovozyma castellii]
MTAPPLRPSLHPSKTETKLRGRQSKKVNTGPASWIRSASTSSMRRLRNHANKSQTRSTPHSPSRLASSKNADDKIPSPSSARHSSSVERNTPSKPTNIQMQNNYNTNSKDLPVGESLDDLDEDDIVFDVLPSFEMYNALHRHIPQGNVNPDLHDFPPSYGEIQQGMATTAYIENNVDLTTYPLQQPPLAHHSNSGHDIHITPSYALNALHPLNTQHLTIQPTNDPSVDHIDTPFQDDLNESDNLFIDKLYTLPKIDTPVEIEIKITKHAGSPHTKPEEESILKEYTSGDIIHGYCIIENKSSKALPFEMFYVTLEAYTSVIDKTKGKRTVKRFLRMVDLSASWSYTNIFMGTGWKMTPGEIDFDNAVIGLRNSRILEPGTRYKKYFMFKLPNQLLDTTCKQEHFSHCLLPPSFGIDKYRNGCKYSGIKVNNVLGSGHLGTKGSPILTYDMVDDNLSVNYTVDTRVVGKDPKNKQRIVIMREREYNLRVIPFGFGSALVGERGCSTQLKDLIALIQERLSAVDKIFKRLEKNEPITSADIHGSDITGTVDANTELDSGEILTRKLDQLHVHNRMDGPYKYSDISDFKGLTQKTDEMVESELNYRIKGKSKSGSRIGLFAGFQAALTGSSSSSSGPMADSSSHDLAEAKVDKLGMILATATIPQKSLPYWAPSLLKKTNVFEKKTKHAQENWMRLLNLLPEEERTPLTKLDIHLTCIQSNNSVPHEPAEIQAITTELFCITVRSDNSIPIKLNAQNLMDEDKLDNMRKTFQSFQKTIQKYQRKFRDNFEKLNELYNVDRTVATSRELKFSNFITQQIYNDVESLANLNVKVTGLPEVFKKQLNTLKSDSALVSSLTGSTLKPSTSGENSSNAIPIVNAKGGLSSSTSLISRASTSNRFHDQIIRSWKKKSDLQYDRDVNVNLEFNQNLIQTLVPSFESCLCCRFYCVRVNIKFHHIGTVTIDVPISVKNFVP